MRSEKEVSAKLAQVTKSLKDTQRNFEKWDSSEDMHAIEVMRGQIAVLDWVINKPRLCRECRKRPADVITRLIGGLCTECRDKLQDRISRD